MLMNRESINRANLERIAQLELELALTIVAKINMETDAINIGLFSASLDDLDFPKRMTVDPMKSMINRPEWNTSASRVD